MAAVKKPPKTEDDSLRGPIILAKIITDALQRKQEVSKCVCAAINGAATSVQLLIIILWCLNRDNQRIITQSWSSCLHQILKYAVDINYIVSHEVLYCSP